MGGGAMTISCADRNEARAKQMGLVPHHAYSVIDVAGRLPHEEPGHWSGGRAFLRLRNPHGKTAWKGKWGEGPESGWDEADATRVKEHLLAGARNSSALTRLSSNASSPLSGGSFWIELRDVVQWFDHYSWCWLPLHHQTVRGQFDDAREADQGNEQWGTANPHFLLEVHEQSKLTVKVNKADRRFEADDLDSVWLRLLPDRDGFPLKLVRDDCLATKETLKRSFYDELRPGKYWIVPECRAHGRRGKFVLQVASVEKFTLTERKKSDYWRTIVARATVDEPWGRTTVVSGVPRMVFTVRKMCAVRVRAWCESDEDDAAIQVHLCRGEHEAVDGKLRDQSVIKSSSHLECPQLTAGTYTCLAKPTGHTSPVEVEVTLECTDARVSDFDVKEPCVQVCAQCGQPGRAESLLQGRTAKHGHAYHLHRECSDAYKAARAPKCLHCGEPVLGIFYPHGDDGNYQEDGKHRVHSDCFEEYRRRNGR